MTKKDILSKIKENHVKQRHQLWFLCKNVLFWIGFVLFALLGAKAVGILLYSIFEMDADLVAGGYMQVHPSMLVLPVLWLALWALFIFVALEALKHTEEGYLHSMKKLLALNVGLSVLLGVVSFATGAAEYADDNVVHHVPFMQSVHDRQEELWEHAEEGRLMGRVQRVDPAANSFVLMDRQQGQWNVDASQSQILPGVQAQRGELLRVLGEKLEDREFRAEVIAPGRRP